MGRTVHGVCGLYLSLARVVGCEGEPAPVSFACSIALAPLHSLPRLCSLAYLRSSVGQKDGLSLRRRLSFCILRRVSSPWVPRRRLRLQPSPVALPLRDAHAGAHCASAVDRSRTAAYRNRTVQPQLVVLIGTAGLQHLDPCVHALDAARV
jgi:hypothetical protein